MPEKIIRDPVHDVIAFRLEKPIDALLFQLINAEEFQRLRRIRQLGMASFAYPGADHSRYSHSLGVMETARQILDQLGKSHYIAAESRTICLAAALLHDLGHGPFSHVFERVSGIEHELLTQRVILDCDSQIHQILAGYDKQLPQKIVEFLRCRPKRTFLCDVISSQLDADRLDYLLRDNLMTGSRYGGYDLRWLLHSMTIDEKSDRLAVNWKGVSAVEAYLQARYHMYRNVYFHKVVRAAEGMVRLALRRAQVLASQSKLRWGEHDEPVRKSLMGEQLTIGEFTELDDVSVVQCFKRWAQSDDAILGELCRGLLFRGVYKTIDVSRFDPQRSAQAFESAKSAIASAGGDVDYEIFYDEIADTPYEKYDPHEGDVSSEIIVCDPDGTAREFASISPITEALNRELTIRRIHVSPRWKETVTAAILQM